jgi:hypothetical protein
MQPTVTRLGMLPCCHITLMCCACTLSPLCLQAPSWLCRARPSLASHQEQVVEPLPKPLGSGRASTKGRHSLPNLVPSGCTQSAVCYSRS